MLNLQLKNDVRSSVCVDQFFQMYKYLYLFLMYVEIPFSLFYKIKHLNN